MRRVWILTLALLLLAGCGRTEAVREAPPSPAPLSVDLMEGVEPRANVSDEALSREGAVAAADFGLRLLQGCLNEGGENTLVSPLSVLEAMAMTANGAAGRTLSQMEKTFGMDLEGLNAFLAAYAAALPDGDGGSLKMANGIWVNADAGFEPGGDFLQANADYYGAGAYKAPFDGATLDDINDFVSEHTAGRIPSILDQLSPQAATVLVNALTFDGAWEEIYRADQVRAGVFTTGAGESRDAELMWSTEHGFLKDENAVGFVKYYEDRGYAFAALLPAEGVSLADYASSLTGERLMDLLDSADESVYVDAAIPKFSASYGAELGRVLAGMGMDDAFDPEAADFSRMGSCEAGPLYIGRVAHRTFIRVDEAGTEAGAATAVEVRAAGMLGPEEAVHLDRPFLYMIVDCAQHVPVFLGVVTDIG